jgi:hypothetical protein
MQPKRQFILFFVLPVVLLLPAVVRPAQNPLAFAGQDLHLSGKNLISFQLSAKEHCLLFTENFHLVIGGVSFTSDSAVIWLESPPSGGPLAHYNAKAYLTGNISTMQAKNALTARLAQQSVDDGHALIVRFEVTGEIFITADKSQITDPQNLELYKKAARFRPTMTSLEPAFLIQKQAMVPGSAEGGAAQPAEEEKKNVPAQSFIEKALAQQKRGSAEGGYPVNIAPAGETPLKIESAPAEGIDAATVIGRFYIWQKQDESGRVLELQADKAVIFYAGQPPVPVRRRQTQPQTQQEPNSTQLVPPEGAIKAVYVAGDVQMTDGPRTIKADEIYYDFEAKNAIILNASMRSFDENRNIPIYVRAAKLRELAQSNFVAENVTITTSEFYEPQVAATASAALVTDTTNVDSQAGGVNKNSYQAEMQDVKFKLDDYTFFAWPHISTNLERPDVPIRRIRFSQDNHWGPSLETEWYFARLLGLHEPEGVDGTMMVDYFGKRGLGVGSEIDYAKETYYGRILGYYIDDHGEDYLGRDDSRRDLEPPNETRGRFSLRHRQFLPDKWQLTTEFNYASDENFIESFYRGEYNVYRPETYLHLKQIKDNRALSILGKWRTNDFEDTLQELPTVEYHRTADSLPTDVFSLYTDIQLSRFQQRIGENHTTVIDEDPFTFISYRSELDMPLRLDTIKVVPYIAGTFGYDDRSGFRRSLVDGSNTGPFGEEQLWIGEAGIRIFPQAWWKVFPDVNSRLFDLDQLRHVIQPSITAVLFEESDKVANQPDIISFGLSQRLQTKRGPADNKQAVDWMRLDTEFVSVENNSDATDAGPGPDRFLWAKPIVPLRVLSAPQIFNGDLKPSSLHRFELYGPKRDYMSADYFWRLSDTTAMLSDLYYDTRGGTIEQFDVGFSRLAWPNLTYYIGSRYLKRTDILGEKGSNVFTFAATYILDPRYTMVFAQQFDFDYGSNIRSDITLIRNYHRVSCAFTISVDDSLQRRAIMFSIWPEGVKEMAIGDKRYMELGGSSGF